jgi:pimeloyl-ACP methyl ester carboxylesterase
MKTLLLYQRTKAIAVFLAIFLTLNGSIINAAEQSVDSLTIRQKTEKVVKAFEQGDFEAITVYFDETMKKQLPSNTLGMVWVQTNMTYGKLEKADMGGIKEFRIDKYDVIEVPFVFQKENRNFRLVFNEAGEISGLFFLPLEVKPANRPQEPSPNSAQTKSKEEEMVLHAGEFKIYGTLKVPDTKGKVPIALFIAGSGPTDRNCNNPQMTCNTFKMLTDSLNNHGIATLSYDKRGIAQSVTKQKEEDLRFEDFVEDAKSWIDLLSQNKRFSEIIVIGHSEGSLIGMIACVNNPKASKFISIAGVGSSADEILKEQLSKRLEGQPITIKSQVFSYIDELKQGRLLEDVPASLYALFRPSVQPYMISWFKYDPPKEIAKLKIPILILQGDLDVQVSENEAKLLYEANPNAKKVVIKNMNHVLKNSQSTDLNEQIKDSYNNPNTPVNQELVEYIVAFVKQ